MAKETMYSYLSSYLSEDFISALKEEMENKGPNKGLYLNKERCPEETLLSEIKDPRQDKDNQCLFRYDPAACAPGKNPLHFGGAYYILDPSAVEAISHLGQGQKEIVLDMCAAPGGKTIAYALNNPLSLIVANDIAANRAQELASNVERLGLKNVIVTSLDPSFFLKDFSGFFSKVILDAPCSGTGMFRKEAKMAEDWTYEKAMRLLPIQDDLLAIASKLVRKGGEILYITCSFLKEEDEDRLSRLLEENNEIFISPLLMKKTYCEGTLKNTVHLFPTLFEGEGHFFALLGRSGNEDVTYLPYKKAVPDENSDLWTFEYRHETYGLSYPEAHLLTLPALKMGVKITDHSEYAKIPFDHNYSHILSSQNSLSLSYEDAMKYLRGEELKANEDIPDGPVIFSYRGLNLGYGKKKGSRIHNLYPKGLRLVNL